MFGNFFRKIVRDRYHFFFVLCIASYFLIFTPNQLTFLVENLYGGRSFFSQFTIFIIFLSCVKLSEFLIIALRSLVSKAPIMLWILYILIIALMIYGLFQK